MPHETGAQKLTGATVTWVETFKIFEILGRTVEREAFAWDAFHRNIPFQPWEFGLQLRTVRTDYPGNSRPTEQILGSNFTPFTLAGRWSDKFNRFGTYENGGYADATRKEFEELVARGNLIKIKFQDLVFDGLITNVDFTYKRKDEIGYSFTFSPHHRQPGNSTQSRSPRTALNAAQLRDEVVEIRDRAKAIHGQAPKLFITGTLYSDVDTKLAAWDSSISVIEEVTNNRTALPALEPQSALRRLAAEFILLKTTSQELYQLLRDARSDNDLFFETYALILDFDFWAKGIQEQLHTMIFRADRSATDLTLRAKPGALALYRPFAGESLYGISNLFYNTPHNWRAIVARNNLGNDFTLEGDELLIIPEVVAR